MTLTLFWLRPWLTDRLVEGGGGRRGKPIQSNSDTRDWATIRLVGLDYLAKIFKIA